MGFRVLLITPSLKLKGGVVEYNKMLCKYSKNTIDTFEIQSVGAKHFFKFYFLLKDFIRLIFILPSGYDIVQVGPSLGLNAIIRDSIFILVCKIFKKKVFVQWHGWNPNNEYLLEKYNWFLKRTLFKANHISLLSSTFLNKIKNNGYKGEVSLGNTFVEDELLKVNSIKELNHDNYEFLFLSTISRNKGIYEALDLFKSLKINFKNIKLSIAGEGPELDRAKLYVNNNNIEDVKFLGFLKGASKSKLLTASHVYLFPSHYEGMPTSLLEAMAFGLVLVSSDVGAIPDFFENKSMGISSSNKDFIDASQLFLENLLSTGNDIKEIEKFNTNFARTNFIASNTVEKIDKQIIDIICK